MGQPACRESRAHRGIRPAIAVAAIAIATLLAACGGGDGGDGAARPAEAGSTPAGPPVRWTLVLDYEPNAVHAGVLRALDAGYFAQGGIDLEVVAPSSTSDALTQVSRGRAEIGLADLIDVARRNERSSSDDASERTPPVAVAGAVVQRPLSGLIVDAARGIASPADLAGKRIAVSGLPSDVAVVRAIVRGASGPLPTKDITLGFNGLKALSAGRVEASTAYWPADEVSYEALGRKGRVFALDRFGGPRYPGLVAVTTRALRQRDPGHVRAFAAALARGTADVVRDPAAGLRAVSTRYPELDAATTKQQLANYVPLFGDRSRAGRLNREDLAAFTAFAAESGLTSRRLRLDELTEGAGAPEDPGTR